MWLDNADAETSPSPEAAPPEEPPEPPPLARLVYHVLSERTAIFAVTPDGTVHGHVATLGRNELADQIGSLRRMLKVDEDLRGVEVQRRISRTPESAVPVGDYRSLLRTLYAELVEPLAAVLPDDGMPVVIEPHGPLWLLPFAALLGSDDTWLAERWPLLHTPSSQILDQIRHEPDYGGPDDLKALIVGNPQMPLLQEHDGLTVRLAPLPGAAEEAASIADLFPGERHTLLIGAAADLETVIAQVEQNGVLHLATHGIAYADDPLNSFLALAGSPDGDALLTARQVLSLTVPADLVTLSACQTGLGLISGDGVIGLSGAFLASGARAVLVSGWSVSDRATALLMRAYYRAYVDVDNKALALQQAMQAVREQPGFDHPRYWAAFAVIGAEA